MNGVPGPAPAPCGTRAGYKRHRSHGERPCLACYDANAIYEDDRRKAPARRAALEEAVSRRGPRLGHSLEADGGPSYGDRREAIDVGGAA